MNTLDSDYFLDKKMLAGKGLNKVIQEQTPSLEFGVSFAIHVTNG